MAMILHRFWFYCVPSFFSAKEILIMIAKRYVDSAAGKILSDIQCIYPQPLVFAGGLLFLPEFAIYKSVSVSLSLSKGCNLCLYKFP